MTRAASEKTVHIATFGCQMNTYDSARMAGLLATLGYGQVQSPQDADLVVVNTCSVRERAEQKVYSYLGSLKGLKQRRPGMLIGIGGCVAQQEGAKLLKHIPHLDFVFGTNDLERLPELVAEASHGRRLSLTGNHPAPVSSLCNGTAQSGLKALVTVMTGCDNFCSYCVVPYVRGRERSRPAGEIVDEVAALAAKGVREVTLLGQNVNSYRDADSGLDFAGLLARVARVDDIWRLRFTTSHPKDLSPALIEVMAGEPKVMEQLHLPAQSGSDRVLAAMRRGYTRAEYMAKVEALRKRLPQAALGGDIIVGFPGESEEEFEQSLDLLRQVRYDFLFSFKYSDRPFTRASRLENKLDDAGKVRRLTRLQALQRGIGLELHQALEGSTCQVMVEGPAKRGQGLVSGRSRAGQVVNFEGGPELVGSLVDVLIIEGRENSLMGRLPQPPERQES